MRKSEKNGFTLVELLAVIAVLGLILIVAIPKVMETLNTQKKRTLELTTRSIIKAAEEKYLENSAYGINEEITCEGISNITSSDFESCKISFDDNGNASVTLIGKGRYNGINVCNATKENTESVNVSCDSVCDSDEMSVNVNVPNIPYQVKDENTCVTYITNLLEEYNMLDTYSAVISPLCSGDTIEEMDFNAAVLSLMDNDILTEQDLIDNDVIVFNNENVCVPKLPNNGVTYIKNLYDNEEFHNYLGLIKDNTIDKNIRYSGSSGKVKNYVEFGNTGELWRIIGIFKVSDGTKTEERIKLVKVNSIGNYSWDFDALNDGTGINQWGDNAEYNGADLMIELNTLYLNQDSGYCCNNTGYSNTCQDSSYSHTACDFTSTSENTKGISSMYSNMIDEVVWNTGAITSDDIQSDSITTTNIYNLERGSNNGKICIYNGYADSACTDKVLRTTNWKGKIGLIYPSDWGYASSITGCDTNMMFGFDVENPNLICKNNNWLQKFYMDYFMWTITPVGSLNFSSTVMLITNTGVNFSIAARPFEVYPSVYLKPNTKIVSGDGTISNPYKLSL